MLSRTSFSRRWGLYEAPRPASPASRLRRVYRSGCPRHRQSHRPLPGERRGGKKAPSAPSICRGSAPRFPIAGRCCGRAGRRLPGAGQGEGALPGPPLAPSADRAPRSPAGLSLLAGEADPLLLTGDWRSRCPASPSSALGSCAAGLMLGTGRGSRSLARIRAGSSTTTRRERSAFSHQRGFSPPPPSLTARSPHRAAPGRGHGGIPRRGGCPRGRGAGVPGTQGPLLRLTALSPLPR